MSSLKTYLAANYMSGPKADAILARATDAPVKKKRKKIKNEDYPSGRGESSTGGLLLRDEDESWRKRDEDDLDGEDAPVIGKDIATFQKSKSTWSSVGATSLPMRSKNATAGPSSPTIKPDPDLDTPNIKRDPDAPPSPPPPPVQITKRRGGLRTAAQMQEEADRLAAEMAGRSPSPARDESAPDPTVTVHRDASGRIVDVKALKEEERRKEEEEKRKEKERESWSKGITQRREKEERAKLEAEMASHDVARRADDVGMNRELREVERWNDPAAGFLTQKKSGNKGPKRPKYKGAAPLNRFGILPGYRWDGVDRSNGFEKKAFQYQNAAARTQYEANQWSVEDM